MTTDSRSSFQVLMMPSPSNDARRHLVTCQTPEHGTVSIDGGTCADEGCLCDTVKLKVTARGRTTELTLTSDGALFDADFQQAEPFWTEVVRAIWREPDFQRGFESLVTQRRTQVLHAMGRLEGSFEVRLSDDVLGESADLERDTLGLLALRGQRYAYKVELCADPKCECENLFLVVWKRGETGRAVFALMPSGLWMMEEAGCPELDMDAVEPLVATGSFQALLGQLRVERILQKYHRFLHGTLAHT